MKNSRLLYLGLGFISGILYLVSCGGGSSGVTDAISQASTSIINAIDVVYDNTASKLVSTNVQGAIDELAVKPAGGETFTSSQIIGTWKGDQYIMGGNTINDVILVFGADGSVSCPNGLSAGLGSAGFHYCHSPDERNYPYYKWNIRGNSVLVEKTAIGSDGIVEVSLGGILQVDYADGANLGLYIRPGNANGQPTFFFGTKQ